MKQSISFPELAVKLFLVSLLVATGCAASEAPYRVFILAGQSNMVGSGEVAALDSAERALPANVTLFDHGRSANLEQRAHRFGPELTFAQRLAEVFPEFETLITRLRNDLNTPALPILFGRVNPPPERYPARDLVNEAQEKIAVDLAFTYLVDTDELSKLDDDLHYNTEGQQALGRRFADTYLNLLRR